MVFYPTGQPTGFIDHPRLFTEEDNMNADLQQTEQVRRQKGRALLRGIGWGIVGGFIATIVLHIVSVATLWALGYPGDLFFYFSMVAATTAGFLSRIGLTVTDDLLLGAIVSYSIGMGLGAIFGAIVSQVNSLRMDKTKRFMFGLLFVAVITQPLVAAAPIILEDSWTATETWQWFLTSFYIHMIYAIVLAVIVDYGLRVAAGEKRRWLWRKTKAPSPEGTLHS